MLKESHDIRLVLMLSTLTEHQSVIKVVSICETSLKFAVEYSKTMSGLCDMVYTVF